MHRAAFALLILICCCVDNVSAMSCEMMPWPTMGSSQIKAESRTWLQNHNHNAEHSRQNKRNKITSPTTTCRCKFFLWNIVSYIKYKETTYQVNENTIEGLGGKRYVRMPTGSLLERWYPQLRANQLKTDGCILCGYSFREHLEYWWWCKKQATGGVSKFESVIGSEVRRRSGGKKYSSYNQYVNELLDSSRRIQRKRLREKFEIRDSFEGNVSYVIPPFDPLADGEPKRIWTVLLLALARTAALVRLEDLIWLDRIEHLNSKGVMNS